MKTKKQNLKDIRGITLIVLIITVIILLILTGVTMNIAVNGGLFDNAQEAVDDTNRGLAQDQRESEKLLSEWDAIEEGVNGGIAEEELGNYMVDKKTYRNTLAEALQIAEDGSVIDVINDTTEASDELITIDKDITIETNGKTITGYKIEVSESKNVVINGNGKISKIDNSMSDSLILNYGNIEINNATIYSSSAGDLMATISVLDGTVTSNNATINGITAYAGPVTINGGTYEYISTSPVGSGNYIINSGTIGELGMRCGGHVNINGGTVTKIHLADDSSGIYLTIGSLDLAVSSTNPCIEEIMFRTDLAGCIGMVEINFYNGIVKTVSGSVELFEETGFYTAIRPGYTSQVTTNGTILVPST